MYTASVQTLGELANDDTRSVFNISNGPNCVWVVCHSLSPRDEDYAGVLSTSDVQVNSRSPHHKPSVILIEAVNHWPMTLSGFMQIFAAIMLLNCASAPPSLFSMNHTAYMYGDNHQGQVTIRCNTQPVHWQHTASHKATIHTLLSPSVFFTPFFHPPQSNIRT